MSPDDRTVDDEVFHVRFFDEMLVHSLPDTPVAPSGKAFVDSVPLAVLRRKQSPLSTRSGDPENGFDESFAAIFLSDVYVRAFPQEVENLRPLF